MMMFFKENKKTKLGSFFSKQTNTYQLLSTIKKERKKGLVVDSLLHPIPQQLSLLLRALSSTPLSLSSLSLLSISIYISIYSKNCNSTSPYTFSLLLFSIAHNLN
jgi:hypothetical protein